MKLSARDWTDYDGVSIQRTIEDAAGRVSLPLAERERETER